jgi:ATP-dependent Clp protease adaptor protein ClpS
MPSPNHSNTDEPARSDNTSGNSSTAVAPARARPKSDPKQKPKPQPPYAVVIFNDPIHSFEYVIELLQRVFGYDLTKAMQLTLEAHKNERAVVWSGPMETAEFKRDRIRGFGPDTYNVRIVTMPLGCAIEPLPQ